MRRLPLLLLITAILTLLGVYPVLASGGGSSSGGAASAPPAPIAQTPEQMARDHYNAGLRLRDKAWKLEEKAEEASNEAARDKLLAKAQKQFEKAAERFTKATELAPRAHQAYSSLGYSLRRTGDYPASLEAYDKALAIAPNYTEAIEYRAEAYLGLNRVDEAKEAYMFLFNYDRPKADELLEAMQKWVEERKEDPAGVGGDVVEGFASWVVERSEVADQVSDALTGSRTSWGD